MATYITKSGRILCRGLFSLHIVNPCVLQGIDDAAIQEITEQTRELESGIALRAEKEPMRFQNIISEIALVQHIFRPNSIIGFP